MQEQKQRRGKKKKMRGLQVTNRTVLCLVASFAAGLLYGKEEKVGIFLCLFVFCLFRIFYLKQQRGRKTIPITILHMILCMVLFVGGIVHYMDYQTKFQEVQQYAKSQRTIQVQGRIYQKEQKQEQFIYYLEDAWILKEEGYESSNKIQVYTSKDSYNIGNYVQVVGEYEAFQLPRNEGNFNEQQYYYSKKIGLRMTAYEERLIDASVHKYKIWLLEKRQEMEQVFLKAMPQQTAGIMANMTLGSKNLADKEIKALYQKAGISHVLAVSGLHVSIFGMGLYRLLRRLYCPIPLASLLASGIVYSFGVLTGLELSTCRAIVMFFLMMFAGTIRYTYDTITALSVSALLQLWDNPFVLWYAGFLLSYSAVLGAVVITGIVRNLQRKRRGAFIGTMQSSLCIQMATLPVLLYFYYEVSLYSIVVNAIILPIMGVLLFLGAVGGIVGLFHMGLAAVILKIPAGILWMSQEICQFFTKLPRSNLITGQPSMEKILVYYVVLILFMYIVYKTEKKRYFLCGIACMCILCMANGKRGAEVDFLDVGQGDGIYIQSEQGNAAFIDGGSTDVGKVGTYRILPFLKCYGRKEISLWFVSHMDADHVSGLKEILEEGYPVKNIVFAKGVVRDEAWEGLVDLAEKNGSQIHYLKAGESITLDDLQFTLAYPWKEGTDRNANSMVLLAKIDGMKGIFSGDIGKEQEQELLADKKMQQYLNEPITFYKAAHHGSNGSNSLEFLEAIAPRLTVVSCGKNNSYGHPGKEAVAHMEQAKTKIYYTMENGQIKLKKGDNGINIWKFQN